MMPAARAALGLTLASTPAMAGLVCAGEGFALIARDDAAQFTYLGDGTFALSPPVPEPGFGFLRLTLATAGGDIAIYLEERACDVADADLPLSIEIAIDTSRGLEPRVGCCTWTRS